MNQEFKDQIQQVSFKMKQILELVTEKEWTVDPVIEIWDVFFKCTISDFPDFAFQSRYIEFGRHIDFVERFGWDEYAVSFANEARMYFQNQCFKHAKEQLGFTDNVLEA